MEESFTVTVNNNRYIIKPTWEYDCALYEVSTECEKMFTLKMGEDGFWKTEENVIPLNNNIIADIGTAIERHEM